MDICGQRTSVDFHSVIKGSVNCEIIRILTSIKSCNDKDYVIYIQIRFGFFTPGFGEYIELIPLIFRHPFTAVVKM